MKGGGGDLIAERFFNRTDRILSVIGSGQVRVFIVHIQRKLLWRTPVTGTGTDLHRYQLNSI